MLLPDGGSLLLYWMRCSLRRSLRRVRSNARLYEALAARETDDIFRELYRREAEHQRDRAARKIGSLFSLRARLPDDTDPFMARTWRRVLRLCGPRVVVGWIEWRESRELSLILAVARVITRLTTLRNARATPPTARFRGARER